MKLKKLKCLVLCAAAAAGALFTGCSSTVKGGNIDEVTLNSGDLVAVIEIEDYGTIKAKLYPDIAPVGVENFQKLCESGFYKGLKIHRVMADFMFQGGSLNGDGTGGEALVNGGSFGVEAAENMRHFYGALCYANAGGQNSTQFYIVNNKKQNVYGSDFRYFKSMVSQCDELIKQYEADGVSEAVSYYKSYRDYYQKLIDKYEKLPENVIDIYNKDGGVPQLDGDYTVFGQVYEGFDVIDAVSAVEVEDNGYGEVSKPVEEIIIRDITVSTVE